MSSVQVKICGITNPQDAELAASAGADAIGMVFYPPSPRHVADLGVAREIAMAAGPFVSVLGLVVNSDRAFIEQLLDQVPLNMLQFHGDENESQCALYRVPFLKALRMKPGLDLEASFAQFGQARGILLDTYVKGVPGGTGESFNWNLVPHKPSKPLVLAGGLTPANVALAVQTARPTGVDVSGGVEREPGLKDPQKVREFIVNAKSGAVS
ncbi:N-(5'-phosphoribosyl)anthranilate isomerase [Thalassocella blandensis]|nr:N-(5'-phosphoribosyl)anthranilate isomerase [Thalassocella blandensis]